jgi:hypothetical protein
VVEKLIAVLRAKSGDRGVVRYLGKNHGRKFCNLRTQYNKSVPATLKSTKEIAYCGAVISTVGSIAVARYISLSMGTQNQSNTVFFPEKTLSMYPPNGFTMTVTIARNRPYWTIL